MPFKSKAQRRWMYANHPEMAKEWSEHTSKKSKLPEKVKQANMTTQEQAYLEGFVKRASEYGIDEDQAMQMLKTSGALSTVAKMQAKGADPRYLKHILSSRKAVADQIRAARNIAPHWGENSAIREAYGRPSTTLFDRGANLENLSDSIHLALEHTDHISPRNVRGRVQNILGDDLMHEARSRLRPPVGLPQRVFDNVEPRINK